MLYKQSVFDLMKEDVIIQGICKMKKNRITIVNQHPPSIDFADGVELLEF